MVKKIQKDLTGRVEDLISSKFNKIKNSFSVSLTSVFNKSLKNEVGFGVKLGKASEQNIRKRYNVLKNIMLKDIENLQNKKTQEISRKVAQAYAMGKPISKVKSDIMEELQKSHFEIERIVRTNTAYMSSLTKLLSLQEMGFTHYQWQTGVFDNKTRENHRRANGKVFSIKDALAGRAPIPGHWVDRNGKVVLSESINCRCGIKAYK